MSLDRIIQQLTQFDLIPTTTETATVTGTGVDITTLEGIAAAILDAEAMTGTTPTLNVKLQHSATLGGTYVDITGAVFAEVDDTAGGSRQVIKFNASEANNFVRAVGTIAGGTPSVILSVNLLGVKKYNN